MDTPLNDHEKRHRGGLVALVVDGLMMLFSAFLIMVLCHVIDLKITVPPAAGFCAAVLSGVAAFILVVVGDFAISSYFEDQETETGVLVLRGYIRTLPFVLLIIVAASASSGGAAIGALVGLGLGWLGTYPL